MKIVIAGGSGQVGAVLSRAFLRDDHAVVILSRRPQPGPRPVIQWDGVTVGAWSRDLDGCDVVINLAGRSVNCRYTAGNRAAILNSRILSTRAIGRAISQVAHPPRVWLQASTATIYAHRYDAPNDEISGILGGEEPDAPSTWNFSIDVARAWELEFNSAAAPKTRKVALRSALTLSPDPGGIFATLLDLVRRGMGGQAGDGRQFVSWIHHTDFVRAIQWIVDREHLDGVLNIASPNPLPNADFMRALRAAWGAPLGMPATKLMLEVGAVFLRTETELILKSRRVVPRRLQEDGFEFTYPAWSVAARELCAAVRFAATDRSLAA